MRYIKTLILEDSLDSVKVLQLGIESFNRKNEDWNIKLIGHSDTTDGGIAMANCQDSDNPLQLVFIDMTLSDGPNSALVFMTKFPNLSYVLVSKDPNALKIAIRNLNIPNILDNIDKISEGAFGIEEIELALQRFIDKKNNTFFANTVQMGREIINVGDILFFSKVPMAIVNSGGDRLITQCDKCTRQDDHNGFSHYIVSNYLDQKNGKESCLINLYNSNSNTEGRSLASFVSFHNLNEDDFIRVHQSVIINRKFVSINRGTDILINLANGNTAFFKSDKKYLSDAIKEKLSQKPKNS